MSFCFKQAESADSLANELMCQSREHIRSDLALSDKKEARR